MNRHGRHVVRRSLTWIWSSILMGGLGLAGSPLPAQVRTVVPARYAALESPSVGMAAGFQARMRQQVVVAGGTVASLRGRALQALEFRRDFDDGDPLRSSRVRLLVRVGASRRPPTDLSPRFSENLDPRTAVVAYRGVLALPASAKASIPPSWRASDVARIVLTRGLVLDGRDLCIELEGEPLARPAWWPVDFAADGAVGQARSIGSACGFPAAVADEPAGSGPFGIAVGSSIHLSALGRPATPGMLILAGRPLQRPIPLASVGAPGCTLYLPVEVAAPVAYGPARSGFRHGAAFYTLHVPSRPAFAGSRIFVQWVDLETGPKSNALGVTLSNVTELTVAPAVGRFEVSVVETDPTPGPAALPDRGYVKAGYGPVLRLEAR